MNVSFDVDETHDGVVIGLLGEADLSASQTIYRLLAAALALTRGVVEVDLAGLRLLDCTSLGALVRARNDARRAGRVLYVSRPQGVVDKVLTVTHMLAPLTARMPPAGNRCGR